VGFEAAIVCQLNGFEVRRHFELPKGVEISYGGIADCVACVIDPDPPGGQGFAGGTGNDVRRVGRPLVYLVYQRDGEVVVPWKQCCVNIGTCECEIPQLSRTSRRTARETPCQIFKLIAVMATVQAWCGAITNPVCAFGASLRNQCSEEGTDEPIVY